MRTLVIFMWSTGLLLVGSEATSLSTLRYGVFFFSLNKADQRISNRPDSGGGLSNLHCSARRDSNGANQVALVLPTTGQ